MNPMLWTCAILLVMLSGYSFAHYFCVLVFLRSKQVKRIFSDFPESSVAILIPSRNEGEMAMRAIRSALEEDHVGPLEIYLLLKDPNDTSMSYLAAAYPKALLAQETSQVIELSKQGNRRLFVAFTGDDAKSTKLNWIAEKLTTEYLAILDSDHQAHQTWIRSSVILLKENKFRFIQGRRGALATPGFFPLWDSLHQHIGCEMFNVAFASLDLTLFITGTTVVMETELLKNNLLCECLTEDVEFSYRILMQGEKCTYNPYYGSQEEVSPDLYSFIARRRRWANGHTGSFFSHLGKIGQAPLRFKDKLQFLFHGMHYLIAFLVFTLHLNIGLILMQEMSPISRLAAFLSSLILGKMITSSQRSKGFATRFFEACIVFAWIFPAVLILINLSTAILTWDLTQAILPIPSFLQALGLVGLSAPLVVLLAGLYGFSQLNMGSFLWVVITYPIAFYIDVTAVLIGLVDFITNRKYWHVVARAPGRQNLDIQEGELYGSHILGIKESLRLSSLLGGAFMTLNRFFRYFMKPSRAIVWAILFGLFYFGVSYTPSLMLPVSPSTCEVLQHDTDPWIVSPNKIKGYCDKSTVGKNAGWSKRTGSYQTFREDKFESIDSQFWDSLDSTFFCNKAVFSPKNIALMPGGGVRMHLRKEQIGGKDFTSGSMATKDGKNDLFLYGRFEVIMKPAKTSGVVSAFFLYRFDPWQEIDMEFIGRDTTRILLNVYYNPGSPGDLYNYGYRGTPVIVDLGFDAAKDFHRYALEWDAEEIRWFVDGRLIHRRRDGFPTPIPHLPMRFHMNTWPTCSVELAGPFLPTLEPMGAEFKSVTIQKWDPAVLPWLSSFVDYLLPSSTAEDWRKKANWLQSLKPK
jgi:cellulose synthase/poly-beta-1,6-N-acetylglucosamine synthase-like glycosyltransferase